MNLIIKNQDCKTVNGKAETAELYRLFAWRCKTVNGKTDNAELERLFAWKCKAVNGKDLEYLV